VAPGDGAEAGSQSIAKRFTERSMSGDASPIEIVHLIRVSVDAVTVSSVCKMAGTCLVLLVRTHIRCTVNPHSLAYLRKLPVEHAGLAANLPRDTRSLTI